MSENGRGTPRGVTIRCANDTCALSAKSRERGHPPVHRGRFFGIFFPGTRAYLHCYKCGHINQVEVTLAGAMDVVDLGEMAECPTTFQGEALAR